jgi:hypothetical protein
MIVFELPGEIITAVLRSWIEVDTLAKLDSSLCTLKLRAQFLELVGHGTFVADTMCTRSRLSDEKLVQHFEWLVKRQVKVRNWIVNAEVANLCLPANVRHIAGPHVRSLDLRALNAEETMQVFSALEVVCSGIQTLTMEHCARWETLSMLGLTSQLSLRKFLLSHCGSSGCESLPLFPSLRTLHVKYLGDPKVVQSLTSLVRAAPALTDLRLTCFTWNCASDVFLQVLSNHAAGLEILDLHLHEQHFAPAAVIPLAGRCSNLKTLNLLYRGGIDDAVVEAFARHCSRLEALQLRGDFTAASLSAVAVHCGARLRYLAMDMSYCAGDALTVLAERCRLLQELELSNCRFTTEDVLVQLVSSLPCLRELLLVGPVVDTDKVLVAIATHLPNLQHLGLIGRDPLCGGRHTEAGLVALVTALTQLQRLCIQIGYRTSKLPPGLEIYHYPERTRYFERLGY